MITRGQAERFEVIGERVRAVVSQEAKKHNLRTGTVEVPLAANKPVLLKDDTSDVAIEFVPEGMGDAKLQASDGVALYPAAAPGGGDVVLRVTGEGVEDFVVFEQQPAREEIAYRVDVSRVPGLRFLGDYLEFLDKSGDPRLRVSPAYLVDSDGTRHEAAMSVEGCAYDRNWKAPWGRPVTAPGSDSCTVRISWAGDIVYPAVLDPAWIVTGSLAVARTRSASATMADGRVLVCGGQTTGSSAPIASCEIFDPAGGSNGSFSATEAMNVPRYGFELLTGADGRVLAVGAGNASGGNCSVVPPACSTGYYCNTQPATDVCTAEYTSDLYDPTIDPDGSDATVNAWTVSTGDAFSLNGFPSVESGFVLTGDKTYVIKLDYSSIPQRYEFATNAWIADGPTVPLPDSAGPGSWPNRSGSKIVPDPGTPGVTSGVLRIGGYDGTSIGYVDAYDVADGWYDTATPSQNDLEVGTIDYFGWALLEDEGQLLLYGGYNYDTNWLTRAELYDPAAQDWTTFAQELPYPNFGIYSEYYLPGAYHAGADRYLLSVFGGNQSSYMVYNPNNPTTPFSIGYTNFNYLSNVSPHFVSAGTTVLAAPVTVSGSGAKVDARIFEFLDVADTCNQPAECLSGFCRDGVCCSTECAPNCMACSANTKESAADSGTCGPRNQFSYIGYLDDCPSEDQSTCGNTGYCDGLGGCKLYADGTVCDQGTCVDDLSQNDTLFCDGLGNCDPANVTACSDVVEGHKCVGGACRTNCTSDTHCIDGYYCNLWGVFPYQCTPKNGDGDPCPGGNTSECSNGNCVDNVCCSTACTSICQSCNAAYTGAANGTCANISSGYDPNNDCGESGLSPCGLDGSCSPQICEDGDTLQILKACNGSGACTTGSFPDCDTGYSCTNDDCNDTCSSDAECVPGYHCSSLGAPGTCIQDLALGAECSRNQQCPNNQNCVDSVCCNSPCTGSCQACSAVTKAQGTDGTCGPVLAGQDPIDECTTDPSYPSSCLSDGNCNGSGACRTYAPAGVQCNSDQCSSSEQTLWTCTGTGPTCQFTNTPCYPYECGANGLCRGTCTDDTHCAGDSFCAAPSCVGQQPKGTECYNNAACASGFCADIGVDIDVDGVTVIFGDYPGVCCDDDCDALTCQSCKAGLKGYGAEGECQPVNTGLDPNDECEQDGSNICGLNGSCNGAGLCAKAPLGFSCGTTTCVGNSVQGQICDGTGICVDSTSTTDCSPYVCGDVEGVDKCANPCVDDDNCEAGFRCNEGTCVKKLGNGQVCTDSFVCESNYCVDGVCCDNGCLGQCEACDEPGSVGVCAPIEGVPHNDRPACDQAGEECGGECDGVNATACRYAANGTACGEPSCDAGIAASFECNGQGSCNPNAEVECSPYECDTDATCKSRCDVDEDCSQGYACDEGTQRCLPQAVAAECSEDRRESIGNNGTTACRPFLCDVATGACAIACGTTADCATDFVCDSATKTCLPKAPASSIEEEGCSCRTVGSRSSSTGGMAWLAALGLVLAGARRRRHYDRRPKANRLSH